MVTVGTVSPSPGEHEASFIRPLRACDLCGKSALMHPGSSRLPWPGQQCSGRELNCVTAFQGRALLLKAFHLNLPCLTCRSVGEGRCWGPWSGLVGRVMFRRTGALAVQSHVGRGWLHCRCWSPCSRGIIPHPAGRLFPPPPTPPLGRVPAAIPTAGSGTKVGITRHICPRSQSAPDFPASASFSVS